MCSFLAGRRWDARALDVSARAAEASGVYADADERVGGLLPGGGVEGHGLLEFPALLDEAVVDLEPERVEERHVGAQLVVALA